MKKPFVLSTVEVRTATTEPFVLSTVEVRTVDPVLCPVHPSTKLRTNGSVRARRVNGEGTSGRNFHLTFAK
ncbi:MAG TPA: hypothetical protein ENN35_00720 [Deltaproteobacteria bacterium]|nr:hypothetical protein [Deltaproteobacteria bacterium]